MINGKYECVMKKAVNAISFHVDNVHATDTVLFVF